MNELIITGILLAIGLLLMATITVVENADLLREWILDALVFVIDKVIAAGRYIYGLIYDIGTAYCKFKLYRKRRHYEKLRLS